MAKVKALFYLPLRDNDGRSLENEIDNVIMGLYVHFVGWTFLGYAKGAYQMADGSQSLDEHEVYAVVLEESRIPELEALLRDFKGKTLQESIYLEIQRHVEIRFVS